MDEGEYELLIGQIWMARLPGWSRLMRVGVVDIDAPMVALARPAGHTHEQMIEVVHYLIDDIDWIKEVGYATT